jgi:hypothetical protein
MSAAKGQYISTTYTTPGEQDVRTLRINANGELMVAATGGVTGGATAALQTTGNTSLSNIDADLELLKQPTRMIAVTPNDSTDVTTTATKGLWIGTGGNVALKGVGDTGAGTAVTLTNVPSGTYIPGAYCRVMSTNTTASAIVSFYGP